MPFSNLINDEQTEILINDILEFHGYDFTGYSRASFKRRLSRVYYIHNHVSFAEFRYKVLNDKGYFKQFVEEITVNVTEMFRDPSFYKVLRHTVFPNLKSSPIIKIWLAGCSTGEEAYSIAIVLKELNLLDKALIYATDINPAVLEKAAQGIFPLSQMKAHSENYIASGGIEDFSSYYYASYSLAKFEEKLRKKMIFSTHNLVSDRSFNEFQLILCRNVLIYFDRHLQYNVLNLFDQSLECSGYLSLGAKETIEFSSLLNRYQRVENEKIWRKIK